MHFPSGPRGNELEIEPKILERRSPISLSLFADSQKSSEFFARRE